MLSPRIFIKSVRHAWFGLREIAHAEQSFRVQLVVGVGVVCASILFSLQTWERILLLLLVVSVLILEIVNSIFERLADAVHPRLHPTVRDIKDMMAGAVLLLACTAAVVGWVILFPHVLALLCTSAPANIFGTVCSW